MQLHSYSTKITTPTLSLAGKIQTVAQSAPPFLHATNTLITKLSIN